MSFLAHEQQPIIPGTSISSVSGPMMGGNSSALSYSWLLGDRGSLKVLT